MVDYITHSYYYHDQHLIDQLLHARAMLLKLYREGGGARREDGGIIGRK